MLWLKKLWSEISRCYVDCLALLDAIIDYILFLLTLGRWIRGIRLAKGLTQERFAEKLGVDVRTVQRWEADKQVPHARTLANLGIGADDYMLILDAYLSAVKKGIVKDAFPLCSYSVKGKHHEIS